MLPRKNVFGVHKVRLQSQGKCMGSSRNIPDGLPMIAHNMIRFLAYYALICLSCVLQPCLAQEGDLYRTTGSHIFCKTYHHGEIVGIHYTEGAGWLVSQVDPESHIHKLPHLQDLTLSHHCLTVEEARYISSLMSVIRLKLGDLPDEIEINTGALSELGRMTWLKELEISDEHLPADELQLFEQLTSLETLTLQGDLDDKCIEAIYLFRECLPTYLCP
jgi:hypothetical protein